VPPVTDLLKGHPWTATAAAALVAVIVAIVLHRVGRKVLARLARDTVVVRAIFAAADKAAGAALPLAALQVVWSLAPDTLAYITTVRHGNGLLLIAALTWLAMGVIGGIATGVIARNPMAVADNLEARRIQTQARVLSRSAMVLVVVAGISMALMTFPGARQVGASLLASAGVLGLVVGIAARPVFSNLIAGLQLALAQPIRIDDILIVKGEYGRVEEINGTYVVLKLWDERRMIVPLQWFIENPFENWTRNSSQILQSVFLYVDFSMPIEPLRDELRRVLTASPDWDGRVCQLQVTDFTERVMKVRILISAATSNQAFDLGCEVREDLIAFVGREYPGALPRTRMADPEAPPKTVPV
jgi:small-conductance mechanosensitive channel